MNRRGFLGALLAGATLDPDRLLWRPGAKLISIPKPMTRTYSLEEWVEVVEFYKGKQWPQEVLEARLGMGRPVLMWNRIPVIVAETVRRRGIVTYSEEWRGLVVETFRQYRDTQRVVNLLISNTCEVIIQACDQHR